MGKTTGRKKGPLHKDAKDITREYRAFPWAYRETSQHRRIARDVWGFLESEVKINLSGVDQDKARAFLDQGFEFFNSANSTFRQRSRPLLYYYAFLNLGKVALSLAAIPFQDELMHGIKPVYNGPTLIDHKVRWHADQNNKNAFGKLATLFSENRNTTINPGEANIADLLESIPCIHRSFCQMAGLDESFIQADVALLVRPGKAWWRMTMDSTRILPPHKAWLGRLEAAKICNRVTAIRDGQTTNSVWDYQSKPKTRTGSGRNTDIAAAELSVEFRRQVGCHVILQADGYRLYVGATKVQLPQWCIGLAVLFYLGSLTRYRPHTYQAAVEKFSWPVAELLDSLPEQMLYILASWVCGTEVVRPFAVGVDGRG